jgi:hypothetical protein
MVELRKFTEIPKEEQDKLVASYREVMKFKEFSDRANIKVFQNIFGERTGEHLAEKFIEFNRDAFRFLNYLDSTNKTILMVAIFDYTNESGYLDRSLNPIYI